MPSSLKILQQYNYDAVDRLSATSLSAHESVQRFYQGNHLATELGEHSQRTIFRHDSQSLAQHEVVLGSNETKLLASDQAHSSLQSLAQAHTKHWVYTAYGHHQAQNGHRRLVGFNGEPPDAITGNYLLGMGKRAFNPVLMIFNSPDVLSPFDEGGINPYTYCKNDPINIYDPTGNKPVYRIARSNSVPLSVKPSPASGISKRARRISDFMVTSPVQQPTSIATPRAGPAMSIPPYNPDILTQDDLPTAKLLKYIPAHHRYNRYHQELAETGFKYDVMREFYAGIRYAPDETQARKLQWMRTSILRKKTGETLQIGHLAVEQLRIKKTSYEKGIDQLIRSAVEEIRN